MATIGYEKFRCEREDLLNEITPKIKDLFLQKAVYCLKTAQLVKPKFYKQASEDIIIRGERIFDNVEQCDIAECQRREKTALYSLADRFSNIKEEAILVILAEQHDAFVEQLKKLGKLVPSINSNPVDLPLTYAKVYDTKSLRRSVQDFFQTKACKAKSAVVVFNGPLVGDKVALSESHSIVVSEFTELISETFDDTFGHKMLPYVVDVIFQTAPVLRQDSAIFKVLRMCFEIKTTEVFLSCLKEFNVTNNYAKPVMGKRHVQCSEVEPQSSFFETNSEPQPLMHHSSSRWSFASLGYDVVDK